MRDLLLRIRRRLRRLPDVPAEQKSLEAVAEPLSLVRMDRPHYQRGRGSLSGV